MVRSKGTVSKFKKAPQAPRRFKSAYMFFSSEKHKEIRKHEEQKIPTTEVAKMVSRAWKAMPPEERQKWEDLARRDKARFDLEKTLYTGPWKVPAEDRPRKDPNAPKRPSSAFLTFANGKRAMVKRANPVASNAEISQILSRMWKAAPPEHRDPHIKRELELRIQYKEQMAEWKKNSEAEIVNARQEREEVALRTLDKMDQSLEDLNPLPLRGKPYVAASACNMANHQNGQQDLGSLLWPGHFTGMSMPSAAWSFSSPPWSVPNAIRSGDSLEQTLQAAVQLEQGLGFNLPSIEPVPIYQPGFMQSNGQEMQSHGQEMQSNGQEMQSHATVTPHQQFTAPGNISADDLYNTNFHQNLEPNFSQSANNSACYSPDMYQGGHVMNGEDNSFGNL